MPYGAFVRTSLEESQNGSISSSESLLGARKTTIDDITFCRLLEPLERERWGDRMRESQQVAQSCDISSSGSITVALFELMLL